MKDSIRVWWENVTIPTYNIGKPEKNPMFLEKRVYQGSSCVIYPQLVIEKISDEKKDKVYDAIFLENEYIKVMILPELGGRIQMAYDKIKQRHFIYHNQVIKPALVGLTGPWISGGIEFNCPQHHRPSTFDPVDSAIEENSDGSKTVWVNEVERMFRTKGMAYEMMSHDEEAERFFIKATQGIDEPVQAIFYNDPQPDKIFYQGLAWLKLGEKEKAIHIFNRFIAFADEHINNEISIDYFAVSLPDLLVFETDLNKRNKIHCLYIKALGYLGLGKHYISRAQSFFDEVLSLDKNHQGAIIHTKMLKHLHDEDILNRKNRSALYAVTPDKL